MRQRQADEPVVSSTRPIILSAIDDRTKASGLYRVTIGSSVEPAKLVMMDKAFGVPIKAAGTMSLLISIPTMLVGLARHRARGAFQSVRDIGRVVLPMAAGTAAGSAIGGALVVYVPAGAVKLVLGCVLIASALRVFRARHATPARSGSGS